MRLVLDRVGLQVGAERVIEDVSLELEQGTMNVLLGPTLAGKTTLMRLMAGLERPTAGQILLDGKDLANIPVRRRSVAMVYQQFVNYPSLSIYENIASPLRVAGVRRRDLDARVREAARVLRLDPLLDRLPAQLSGGQQQRTAIARALVKRADLVLLDEPLANLDYKLREELREELPRIFAETGAILVYATTEPTEALLLRGHTATLAEGRVTQFGPTASVYRQPLNLDAARVFSDPPLNEAALRQQGARTLLPDGQPIMGSGVRLPEGEYRLAFRVEHASLQAGPGLRFPGTVLATQLNGSERFVHVDVGFARWVCLERGMQDWQPGVPCAVTVDPAGLFVFASGGARTSGDAAETLLAVPA